MEVKFDIGKERKMKRILIALATLIMLIALTSCNNYTTWEATLDFIDTYKTAYPYFNNLEFFTDISSDTYDLSEYADKEITKNLALMLLYSSNENYKIFAPKNGGDRLTIEDASGTVRIERSSDLATFKLTAAGVYVKAKFTPEKETWVEKEKEGTLLLSGTISAEMPSTNDESDIWEFYTVGLEQNSIFYRDIEANMDYDKTKFIKALCNNKEADCNTLTKELLSK